MDKDESKRLFNDADRLYREGRYGEALEVLDRLDAAFPDTKNILVPRAMCLVHLGQVEQGQAIYERLAARYPAEKLQKLRKVLSEAGQQAANPQPMDALDAVLGVQPDDLANARITASPQAVQEARKNAAEGGGKAVKADVDEGPRWGKWAAIGGGVAVVLMILSIPLFVSTDGESAPREASEAPEITVVTQSFLREPSAERQRFLIASAVVGLPLLVILLPLPIFLTLLFFGELPRETFWENYGILLLYMIGINIFSAILAGLLNLFLPGGISGFGWLCGYLYLVHAAFELGFVRTLIFFGFSAAVVVFIEMPLLIMLMQLFYFEVPFSFLFW